MDEKSLASASQAVRSGHLSPRRTDDREWGWASGRVVGFSGWSVAVEGKIGRRIGIQNDCFFIAFLTRSCHNTGKSAGRIAESLCMRRAYKNGAYVNKTTEAKCR